VTLEGVRWAWPVGLDVDRVTLAGTGAFTRADILVAERVRVRLRPLALLGGGLEASSVVVGGLLVRVHRLEGTITHPLSMREPGDSATVNWTDRVRHLRIENGTVEFYDHDAPLFYVGDVLQRRFEARLRDLGADVQTDADGNVRYDINGQLDLGPSHRTGRVAYTATTAADSGETNAELEVDGVPLTAFNPYLERTLVALDDGRMTIRSNTRVVDRVWTTNARVDLTALAVRPAKPGSARAAGSDPSSLLRLFADSSGASSLDVAFTWDRDNPNVTFQQALSSGIRSAVQARAVATLPALLGGLLGTRQGGKGGLGSLLEGLAGAGRGERPAGQRSPWESLFEGRRQPDR
jgi:uncharacterized protein involved in outer membrane biogenesis